MEYTYHCKKNGRDYTITTAVEFAAPQDAYAWRRGVREYMDNYHASITRKNWEGTDDEFTATISAHCDEALARFNVGDVPGERVPSDPKTVAVRKLAAQITAAGVDPMKLAEWLATQTADPPANERPESKKRKAA